MMTAAATAQEKPFDVVILDTAGRLSIDQELMGQVRDISKQVKPDYTFLVVDAMTGQDAVQTAQSFHETLELDGVILTKLDGDARGGAALSVKEVVGKPIAFVSTGEKVKDFDLFHPDRMASRILDMGDMLTLIEQAEKTFDAEQAAKAAARASSTAVASAAPTRPPTGGPPSTSGPTHPSGRAAGRRWCGIAPRCSCGAA